MSAAGMGESLDYFSTELHTIELQQKFAPMLGETNKPFEGAPSFPTTGSLPSTAAR